MNNDNQFQQIDQLRKQGKSVREIAQELGMTYYAVQKQCFKGRTKEMIAPSLIIERVLKSAKTGYEYKIRMIPYCLVDGSLDETENPNEFVQDLIEKGEHVGMCVEIQVQPGIWLNFDCDCLYGSRASQLEYFYTQIKLSDFTNALMFNPACCCNENREWYIAALRECMKEKRKEVEEIIKVIGKSSTNGK